MAVQNSEEKQEQGVKGTQTLMRALDIMDEVIDGPIRAADLARKLGMSKTQFANAAGLPDPNNKASARDLAVLAAAIIRNSAEYYPIYAEREFTYNHIKQGNRNALLYTDPSVDGLKTGHTDEAGYCLVASSKRNGMRLISVILNASSKQAHYKNRAKGQPFFAVFNHEITHESTLHKRQPLVT